MTHSLPSISIIIPLYNVEKYIEDCLRSVESQDYEGSIECIIVDDCSTDESVKAAQHFIDSNSGKVKYRLFRQDKNRKQSAARNKGMELASGDLIYFLDSDDWIDSNTLSEMVAMMLKYPECELVQAGISRTNQASTPWLSWLESKTWDSQIEYSEDKQWIVDTCAMTIGMIPMTPVSKLMRRDFLERYKFKFAEGFYHEDEVWLIMLAKYLKRIAFVHADSYHYRLHNNSTTSGGTITRFEDRRKAWIEIMKLFDKDFCPKSVLKNIDFMTSNYYKQNKDFKVKRIMIEIKLRMLRFHNLRTRLRIIKWMMIHIWKDIAQQPYQDK